MRGTASDRAGESAPDEAVEAPVRHRDVRGCTYVQRRISRVLEVTVNTYGKTFEKWNRKSREWYAVPRDRSHQLFQIRFPAVGQMSANLGQRWDTVSYTHLTLPTNREV